MAKVGGRTLAKTPPEIRSLLDQALNGNEAFVNAVLNSLKSNLSDEGVAEYYLFTRAALQLCTVSCNIIGYHKTLQGIPTFFSKFAQFHHFWFWYYINTRQLEEAERVLELAQKLEIGSFSSNERFRTVLNHSRIVLIHRKSQRQSGVDHFNALVRMAQEIHDEAPIVQMALANLRVRLACSDQFTNVDEAARKEQYELAFRGYNRAKAVQEEWKIEGRDFNPVSNSQITLNRCLAIAMADFRRLIQRPSLFPELEIVKALYEEDKSNLNVVSALLWLFAHKKQSSNADTTRSIDDILSDVDVRALARSQTSASLAILIICFLRGGPKSRQVHKSLRLLLSHSNPPVLDEPSEPLLSIIGNADFSLETLQGLVRAASNGQGLEQVPNRGRFEGSMPYAN